MAKAAQAPELTESEQRALEDAASPDISGDGREPLSQDSIASIFERMVAIIDELPAIGKTQRNEQQKFNFRGHDDVMNALTPLLSKHGVFMVPRVIERVASDSRTTGQGKTMYEVNLHVEYTFYGLTGDSFTASAWGEGTDMGDKSTSKAMTMAFKTVVAQSFAINTEEASRYDADKTSPEETERRDVRQSDDATRPKPPANYSEALKRFDGLLGKEGEASAWLEELVEKAFGVQSVGHLEPADKKRCSVAFFSTLMLLEEQHGDLAFEPNVREIVQGAFKSKIAVAIPDKKDVTLEGPPWALNSKEAEAGLPSREAYLAPATDEPKEA